MTRNDAVREFTEAILPDVLKRYGPHDKTAIRTAWNEFVDGLQKDGRITERQASTWLGPAITRARGE